MTAISSSTNTGAVIGFGGVSLAGVHQEDFHYGFNLNGSLVIGDIGKAVSIDTGAANTVKLAAAGEIVVGRLESFEARLAEGINVGVVATKGGMVLPYDNGGTAGINSPTLGSDIQGGTTAGTVKLLAAAQGRNHIVTSIDSTTTTCVVLFL